MPRQERDPAAADLADHDRRRRLAVRRVDLDLVDDVEERVEPRAAEDADLRFRHGAAVSHVRYSADGAAGEPQFVTFESVREFELAAGVTGKPLFGDGAMLNLITFEPGAVVPLHSHPHEQLGIVIRGEQVLVVGGVEHRLGPLDGYAIPGGVEHPRTAARTVRSCSTSSARCARTTSSAGSARCEAASAVEQIT